MISVITLTYKRHKILEEAIYSFYLQKRKDCEMIIVNDAKDVEYESKIPNIKIYNIKLRFSSILKKLEWGFRQARYNYLYRLDDDDLLSKDGLNIVSNELDSKHDVYRSKSHYLFVNNIYSGICANVNTGNVYTKNYINRIKFIDKSFGEDSDITFKNNGKIKQYNNISMIYRWGMDTYHVSGMGDIPEKELKERIENSVNESGSIKLNPHFAEDYYAKIS